MKTKTTFLLLAISAFYLINNVEAQNPLETVVIGDTVELHVIGSYGDVQWQESTDSLVWNDMSGLIDSVSSFIATTSPTSKKFYRAQITDTLCYNSTPVYSNIIRHRLVNSIIDVQVGDWFHGSIVYYVDGVGNGLIAPLQDQGSALEWGCNDGGTIGAASTTDGAVNTAIIVAYHDALPNYYGNPTQCESNNGGAVAAKACDTLSLNGYDDWFLPAKDQLTLLCQQQALLGNFTNNSYWSSTEDVTNHAWNVPFDNCWNPSPNGKANEQYARCISSFSSIGGPNAISLTSVNQPASVVFNSQPQSQNICLGGDVTFSVVASGTLPINFIWKKDGNDIIGATNSSYTISNVSLADEGIYTCEVTNLCRSVLSDEAELNVIQLDVDAGIGNTICPGQSITLNATGSSNYSAESGTLSYSWTPTTGLSTPGQSSTDADPVTTTDYTVQVTDQLGCTGTDIVNVFVQNPYEDQEICLVTVDTSLWKNKIVWEKVPGVGTSNIFIYKEVALNVYNWLGTVPYDSPGYFIDDSSVPESHGDKYKISVVDTCSAESAKSYYHMTMNLVISTFGSTMGLSWTPYVDESGSYTPANYYIYKGTQPDNMVLLDSISSSFTSYNDNNVFDVYYYMVGVKKDGGCSDGSKALYQNSFSNKKQNSLGINDFGSDNSIKIFPNPFRDKTTLSLVNKNIRNYNLTITDITGKVVRTYQNINKSEFIIERGDLKAGVYIIELKADEIIRGKLIIE